MEEKNYQQCADDYTDREEVLTASCLKEHFGVDAHEALDDQGQELITVAEIEDALLWNRTEQGEVGSVLMSLFLLDICLILTP